MRKTLKADLSHQLESEATSRPEHEPFDRSHSVIIREVKTSTKIKWQNRSLQSQEILNRPVFCVRYSEKSLKILKITKNSEQILKIAENSKQILNITENSEQILNIAENSEQILKIF